MNRGRVTEEPHLNSSSYDFCCRSGHTPNCASRGACIPSNNLSKRHLQFLPPNNPLLTRDQEPWAWSTSVTNTCFERALTLEPGDLKLSKAAHSTGTRLRNFHARGERGKGRKLDRCRSSLLQQLDIYHYFWTGSKTHVLQIFLAAVWVISCN